MTKELSQNGKFTPIKKQYKQSLSNPASAG
jgi:hypothetical protein